MLNKSMLSTVENKMELLERILQTSSFYADFDMSSLYLFVHILVHEKFIFYNFFEKIFVESYVEWQSKSSKKSIELLNRVTFVLAKICYIISHDPGPCCSRQHSAEPVLRHPDQYHKDLQHNQQQRE